jgi:hypothetical protein
MLDIQYDNDVDCFHLSALCVCVCKETDEGNSKSACDATNLQKLKARLIESQMCDTRGRVTALCEVTLFFSELRSKGVGGIPLTDIVSTSHDCSTCQAAELY